MENIRKEGTLHHGGPGRPSLVGFTGWLCVILGGVMVLSAALLAAGAIARHALEEQGIDALATMEGALDPLSRMVLRNLGIFSAVQFLLGGATLVVGIGFLRLRRWARPALEALAWATLGASLASGVWGIIVWLAPAGPSPSAGGGATFAAGLVLTLAQCVACALIIRYLRTDEIRRLFRGHAGP